MRGFVLCSIFASAVAFAGPEAPIIGGTDATSGEFPNVVGVVINTSNSESLCTGTLITNQWVMTAGHCVTPGEETGTSSQQDLTNSITVYVNALDVFPAPPPGNSGIGAMSSMPDPMFDIDNLPAGHDLGLIELAQPVTGITPVTLNFDASAAQPGLAVTQVGYGDNNGPADSGAGTLRTVGQTLVDCATLATFGLSSAENTPLLCYNQSNGTGKCSGDSGGPSFAMINGKVVEVGVTSFGDQNCEAYGTDTRVDFEKSFITSNVPSVTTSTPCTSDADCASAGSGDICWQGACLAAPFSTGAIGASCTASSDCQSNDCLSTNDGSACAIPCTSGACPSGFSCLADGTNGACWADSGGGGGGCNTAGSSGGLAFAGAGLALVLARRPRRRAA